MDVDHNVTTVLAASAAKMDVKHQEQQYDLIVRSGNLALSWGIHAILRKCAADLCALGQRRVVRTFDTIDVLQQWGQQDETIRFVKSMSPFQWQHVANVFLTADCVKRWATWKPIVVALVSGKCAVWNQLAEVAQVVKDALANQCAEYCESCEVAAETIESKLHLSQYEI